ncbi:hypothetical protein [Streptomyces goshikiensis]|uniref:hypothetical protein n=1 Tax=Streptomyces goshikiensis TaxID=1942 RepID=UPI003659CF01
MESEGAPLPRSVGLAAGEHNIHSPSLEDLVISIPVFLLAGGATWLFWRADIRAGVLLAAIICGYALATSPLSGAIDGVGHGISVVFENANANAASH